MNTMKSGIWNAVGAYFLWGIFPIYWKLLAHVPAVQIIGYRVLFSFFTLLVIISLRREWGSLLRSAKDRRILLTYVLTGVLLNLNWMIYVWGVTTGHIVETSLGYFINPLLSVLFGVIFLRERLRPLQWIPLGMVLAGILSLTFAYGTLPWIGLSLAVTFALYGLIKKIAPLGALHGLTLETGVMFSPCVVFLLLLHIEGSGALGTSGWISDLLLVGAGTVTVLPLLMFARAARSIPLWLVGLLQYIAPTLQFLIGVLIYAEPFGNERLAGFAIIWVALLIFWLESFVHRGRRTAQVTADR